MNTLKTRGIALRDYELSEQDKIVTFYTRNRGVLKVVAKGARKIKSRFAAAVQFPSYVDIFVYNSKSSGMGTLTDCSRRYLFPAIKKDIIRFAHASHVAEILLSSLKEEQGNEALFRLLLRVFFLLEKERKDNFEILTSSFKLKLLHILGYAPQLRRCVECGKDRGSFESFYFSPEKGGIVCKRCQRENIQRIGTPKLLIAAMDYLMRSRVGRPFKPSLHRVKKQINHLLDVYFLYHINEKKNNSQRLIQQLEKLR